MNIQNRAIGIFAVISTVSAAAMTWTVSAQAQIPSRTTVPGSVRTSWIGNTSGNCTIPQYNSNGPANPPTPWVQHYIDGIAVSPDGTVYANAYALDASLMWGIYKNGRCLGALPEGAFGRNGGAAIATDGKNVYVAQSATNSGAGERVAQMMTPEKGQVWTGIATYDAQSMRPVTVAGGIGAKKHFINVNTKLDTDHRPGNVWGLAVDGQGHLFASYNTSGTIQVISTSTYAVTSKWTLPDGLEPFQIAWDGADSLLWVLQENAQNQRSIGAYTADGKPAASAIINGTPNWNPVSVHYGNHRLYICDDGVDQNIKVYGNLGSSPSPVKTLGVQGGVFAGSGSEIGTTRNWRFWGLCDAAPDAQGNLIVTQDGRGPDVDESNKRLQEGYGCTLESYNLATGSLNWRLENRMFLDDAKFDPADSTQAYSNTTHFHLDWSANTPGGEWSTTGITLDQFKYPDDWRISHGSTLIATQQVVDIHGRPYLVVGNDGTYVFYRFDRSTNGEIAIPCAGILASNKSPDGHPRASIWTDENGDGHVQSSEVSVWNSYFSNLHPTYIDSNGTIWTEANAPGTIYSLPCRLSNGVPHYSFSTITSRIINSIPTPDPITGVGQLMYDAANDTMYIFGYSTQYPLPTVRGHGVAGSVCEKFTSWTSSPRFEWEQPLPDNRQDSHAEAIAMAGKYLFVQYTEGFLCAVYAKSTGRLVGYISPDTSIVGPYLSNPKTGGVWIDYGHGIDAIARGNGEYDITVEDDIYNKSVLYRWNP